MGGLEKKKWKKGPSAGGIADMKKKKKKKRRRKVGTAIAKICEASKEAGPQQVASSLCLALNCTDSAGAITKKGPKKKKISKALQKYEPPSDETSSEKEKQSLLAWVEMGMTLRCNNDPLRDLQRDVQFGRFAKGASVDRSSNGHIHSLIVCNGDETGVRTCNGDVVADTRDYGACDHLPNADTFKVDHESHICGEKPSTNGCNCQSNHGFFKISSVQSSREGLTHDAAVNYKKGLFPRHVNGSSQSGSSLHTSRSGESECSCPVGATNSYQRDLSNGHARSGEDNASRQAVDLEISNNIRLGNSHVLLSNPADPLCNKRKREDDKVLQYVLKRSIVIHPSPSKLLAKKARTTKTVVFAWGRKIPVTLTSEARTVQEWISSQNGNLFGLDVEWRPNRAKGQKNKVALLQLCNESECLIVQMLFLDKKPQALRKLLSDPSKSLAGVGVLADGKRLLHDYGLECQGGIELTTLAVERLKRDELRNVGLKILVQEVLGLKMDKPKKVTLSNWAKVNLDRAQINYACMDAWASFALLHKLLVDM